MKRRIPTKLRIIWDQTTRNTDIIGLVRISNYAPVSGGALRVAWQRRCIDLLWSYVSLVLSYFGNWKYVTWLENVHTRTYFSSHTQLQLAVRLTSSVPTYFPTNLKYKKIQKKKKCKSLSLQSVHHMTLCDRHLNDDDCKTARLSNLWST